MSGDANNPAALAERYFVGALLHLRGAEARTALAWVAPDDLADPQLRQVLATMRDLGAEDRHDPADIVPAMVRAGRVARDLSGLANVLLVELLAEVPAPAAWRHYAAVIVEAAMRRRLVEIATRLAQAAETSSLAVAVDVLADGFAVAVANLDRIGVTT